MNQKALGAISLLLVILTLILVLKELIEGFGVTNGIIIGVIIITPFLLAVLGSVVIIIIFLWRYQK